MDYMGLFAHIYNLLHRIDAYKCGIELEFPGTKSIAIIHTVFMGRKV